MLVVKKPKHLPFILLPFLILSFMVDPDSGTQIETMCEQSTNHEPDK
jgi:hypothetical protein